MTYEEYKSNRNGVKTRAYNTNCVECGCYMRGHLNFSDRADIVTGQCYVSEFNPEHRCTGFKEAA